MLCKGTKQDRHVLGNNIKRTKVMQNKSWKPRVQDMRRSSIILKLLLHRILISAKLCSTNKTDQLHSYIPWSEDESRPSEGAGLT